MSETVYCQMAQTSIPAELCFAEQGGKGCKGCAAPTRKCVACDTLNALHVQTGLCDSCREKKGKRLGLTLLPIEAELEQLELAAEKVAISLKERSIKIKSRSPKRVTTTVEPEPPLVKAEMPKQVEVKKETVPPEVKKETPKEQLPLVKKEPEFTESNWEDVDHLFHVFGKTIRGSGMSSGHVIYDPVNLILKHFYRNIEVLPESKSQEVAKCLMSFVEEGKLSWTGEKGAAAYLPFSCPFDLRAVARARLGIIKRSRLQGIEPEHDEYPCDAGRMYCHLKGHQNPLKWRLRVNNSALSELDSYSEVRAEIALMAIDTAAFEFRQWFLADNKEDKSYEADMFSIKLDQLQLQYNRISGGGHYLQVHCDGRVYELDHCIHTGNCVDEENYLAVYFTWAEDLQAVLIGGFSHHTEMTPTVALV